MKLSSTLKFVWSTLVLLLCNIVLFAQEKKVDVDINVGKEGGGGTNWYGNPVIWIIGAAVFILLLVALLRGRSKE